MSEVTQILRTMGDGDPHAAKELLALVYEELRRIARFQMGQERSGHTLQATALVHEAYLRLLQDEPVSWDGRRHFIAAAAEAMRRILVERARRHRSLKRGGGHDRVELPDDGAVAAIPSPCPIDDLLSLDEALDRLARLDPVKAELIKLLYFAGLSFEEAGMALGISHSTAHRHWVFARAWLHEAIAGREIISSE